MTLSFASLFSDTKNFVINRIVPILVTLLILAIVAQLISMMFMPSEEVLIPLQQLFDNAFKDDGSFSIQSLQQALQQPEILSLMLNYSIKLLLVSLITNVISTSICLSLIANLSTNSTLNVNQLISRALTLVPQILSFILLSIPFFFVLTLIASLIPPLMIFVILFGMLFYTMIHTIFLSILVAPLSESSVLSKIKESLYRFKKQYKLMLPIMGVWLTTLLVFGAIISSVMGNNIIIETVIGLVGLLLNFFLLSYFYRLYTLTTEKKHDAGY